MQGPSKCVCQNYNAYSLFHLLMKKLCLFPGVYALILFNVLRKEELRAAKKVDEIVCTFIYLKCYFWFCKLLTISCLCLLCYHLHKVGTLTIKNSANTQCETVTLPLQMKKKPHKSCMIQCYLKIKLFPVSFFFLPGKILSKMSFFFFVMNDIDYRQYFDL